MVSGSENAIEEQETNEERPWLARYEPEVPHTVAVPDITSHDFFARVASEYGGNTATIFFGEKLTYGQLNEQANRLASALREGGLGKGGRVAIALPNCPQLIISLLAVLKAGGVAVMLNPGSTPHELDARLGQASVEAAIVLDSLLPRIREAAVGRGVKHLIVTQLQEYLSPLMSLLLSVKQKSEGSAVDLQGEGVQRFAEIVKQSSAEYEGPPSSPDDPAVLLYTGSTITPKGVTLTHRNILNNAYQMNAWLWDTRPEKHDIFLGVMPLYQSYGLTTVLNLAVACAGAMVLLPRFVVKDTLRAIARFKPTIFPAVPAIFSALARHPLSARYDLRSLRVCLSGGAYLGSELIEAFESMTGARLVECYGLTEATAVTHCNPVYGERRAGSIGLPLPMTDARIVDQGSHATLLPGEAGELAVRGPQVAAEYRQETAGRGGAAHDGWLLTGDIARQDEDGYFYIVDRREDVIAVGEHSVFPKEVEDVLSESEKVNEAVVVGVPDKQSGEIVKAFVVLKPDIVATEAELRRFVAERLAGFKVPITIEFRESLPKNDVGRYLRRKLAADNSAARG